MSFLFQHNDEGGDVFQEDQIINNYVQRTFKLKLITNLNHQQQNLARRKKKQLRQFFIIYFCHDRNRTEKALGTLQNLSFTSNKLLVFTETQNINRNKKSNKKKKGQNQNEFNGESRFFKKVYDGNDKIQGYWVNGLLQGDVQIFYYNGDHFKGKFVKGYKLSGKMTYKDQGYYQGGFYNELFHGKGVLSLKDKKITAYWLNGVPQPKSAIQYENGNLYYGSIRDYKKHGYGYLYFTNDTKFHGQFVNDQIKGYGEYYQRGKIKYKGIWLNGKLIQSMKLQDQALKEQEDDFNWDLLQEIFETKNNKKTDLIQCFVQLGQIKRRQNQRQRLQLEQKTKSNLIQNATNKQINLNLEQINNSTKEPIQVQSINIQVL